MHSTRVLTGRPSRIAPTRSRIPFRTRMSLKVPNYVGWSLFKCIEVFISFNMSKYKCLNVYGDDLFCII
jgi:hypothetical protein